MHNLQFFQDASINVSKMQVDEGSLPIRINDSTPTARPDIVTDAMQNIKYFQIIRS